MDRAFSPRGGGGKQGVRDRRIGRQAADDFDQRHLRHGIKKMHARQALRQAQARCDRGHGNRRGIGSQDAVIADHCFQFREQRLLGGQVFDDGFHHQPCMGDSGKRIDQLQPVAGSGCGGR
jgi:hypothetical protein